MAIYAKLNFAPIYSVVSDVLIFDCSIIDAKLFCV